MIQRYIPSEHADALVVIPTPRIKTPVVRRKRYESRNTINTQSRGHDTRLREQCAPSTRTRRDIRWLTTDTPNRWIIALTIVLRPWDMAVYLGMDGKRRGSAETVARLSPVKPTKRALIADRGEE